MKRNLQVCWKENVKLFVLTFNNHEFEYRRLDIDNQSLALGYDHGVSLHWYVILISSPCELRWPQVCIEVIRWIL